MGAVIEKMGRRKADLLSMTPMGSRYRLEFLVPSRGLFGYRSEFLTDTRGEGIMSSVLESYAPMKGDIERRLTGSLISLRDRRGRHLRSARRTGAWRAVHRSRHPGICRYGSGYLQPQRRYECECV